VHEAIKALSDTRREILRYLKHRGGATIAELATHLGISDEGTRQHLIQLERLGWVSRGETRDAGGRSGRPASVYLVSPKGESFFPKRYADLAVALVDTVGEMFGNDAMQAALTRMVDAKVKAWTPRLAGKSLEERLALLKDYYAIDDPFTEVKQNGAPALVERNCPYLNVAMSRPALCSTTVNVLERLLGYQVSRRRRFQNGDGCCEFEVHTDRPVAADQAFKLED